MFVGAGVGVFVGVGMRVSVGSGVFVRAGTGVGNAPCDTPQPVVNSRLDMSTNIKTDDFRCFIVSSSFGLSMTLFLLILPAI